MQEQEKNENCLICQRIALIKQAKNPDLIKEMETGYAVLGWHQLFRGYCLFFCKVHKTELHQLDKDFRLKFLEEMAILAEAVYKTFKPRKLNYELLGNTEDHMHWHIFPRYKNDIAVGRAVWTVDKSIRQSEKYKPTSQERQKLIASIRKNIKL